MFRYTDGPRPAGVPAISATRLQQLQRRIDAWNKLDWVESRMNASVSIWWRKSVGLREGIYMIVNDTEVVCIQLPSHARGVPLHTWKLGNFGFDVSDAEIGPCNDLLVVLSM